MLPIYVELTQTFPNNCTYSRPSFIGVHCGSLQNMLSKELSLTSCITMSLTLTEIFNGQERLQLVSDYCI